jgi:hypothetical protein
VTELVVGPDPFGVHAQPAVHLPAAHLETAHVLLVDQGRSLGGVDPQQQATLAARVDRHVPVNQEREPTEHPLLSQPRLASDDLPDPARQLLVVRHDRSMTRRCPEGLRYGGPAARSG